MRQPHQGHRHPQGEDRTWWACAVRGTSAGDAAVTVHGSKRLNSLPCLGPALALTSDAKGPFSVPVPLPLCCCPSILDVHSGVIFPALVLAMPPLLCPSLGKQPRASPRHPDTQSPPLLPRGLQGRAGPELCPSLVFLIVHLEAASVVLQGTAHQHPATTSPIQATALCVSGVPWPPVTNSSGPSACDTAPSPHQGAFPSRSTRHPLADSRSPRGKTPLPLPSPAALLGSAGFLKQRSWF